jgi:hypothetical protein
MYIDSWREYRWNGDSMRPVLPAILRAVLLSFLLLSSGAILYVTAFNAQTVRSLAERSLESTAQSCPTGSSPTR